MPEKPISTANQPVRLDLAPGTYWYCTCGKTSHGAFCDGSHKGTGLQPLKLEIEEQTTASLCLCKNTKNPPYCDGSHR